MIRLLNRGGPVWGVVGPFDPRVRDICKAIPGMNWNPTHRAWIGYGDAVSVVADICRFKGIDVVGEVKSDTKAASTFAIAYENLRDYQKTGVNFLVDHAAEGCFLTDGLSLGKTCQLTRAARAFKARTVVVCPNSVKGVWEVELAKWWPAARAVNLVGTKASMPPIFNSVDVMIIHYDILHAWADTLIAWGARTLILDEVHRIVGADSRRGKSLQKLARTCSYRMAATGTINPNHTRDLHFIADIISENRFGKFFDFGRRYCGGHQTTIEVVVDGAKVPRAIWDWSGSSNESELKQRLATFMLGRTKEEVSLQLPAVTRQIIELDVGKARKAATAKAALINNAAFRNALDIAADAKQPQVIDLVAGYLQEGRKVVVASYRKKIAQLIREEIRLKLAAAKSMQTTAVVTGEVEVKKRHAIIATKPDLLCCTMDSLGVGVSLAYADLLVVAELHYDPTALMQMEGRLPRSDSKASNVLIVYPIARGTADDVIKRLVLKKLDVRQKTGLATSTALFSDLQGDLKEDAATRMKKLYLKLLEEDE